MSRSRSKYQKTDADKWLDAIAEAKRVKEDWTAKFRVPLSYEYFEGRARPDSVPENEWITINMIYSSLMAELPALYSTDPYYYVKLRKSYSVHPMDIAMFEARARVRQSMLNYLKGELNLKSKARLAIFDAYFQFGLIKLHLYADLMKNDQYGEPMADESGAILYDSQGQQIVQPEFLPANERYCITRVHPDDFLVCADSGPIEPDDVPWKAQRIKRPLEDVKRDKRYKQGARQSVQATELKGEDEKQREARQKGQQKTFGGSGDQKEPDTVVLWEVWDLRNKQWFTVAEGCSQFLTDPAETPPGIDGDPFVSLRLTLRDTSWYPLPPVSQWIDPQREYCEIRSKILTHRKRFNRKYTIYGPAFDDAQVAMSKLEAGEDGTVVEQNQPMQTVYPIQDAPLDQQVHMELSYIRQDFMDLVGAGSNQRGSSAGVDSATEAGIIEKRTQVREGDKQGLVIDFLTEIGRKLDQLVQANITQDQVVKVSGPQGEAWELIRTTDYDEINGEYSYSIQTGSTTPQLPEIERAQWLAFLQALANAPQLAMSISILRRTAEMFHISPDDPMVQEIHQLAQQALSGGMQGGAPGGQMGSLPGIPESNPATAAGAGFGINNIRGGMQ